jgi:chaperone modulatory protein CbpM
MTEATTVIVLDETQISLDEVAGNCNVTRSWIIEHVEAGVLLDNPDPDPARWHFTSRDLLRARQLRTIERQFEANAELAGLFVDLLEEVGRLRRRLRREGLDLD